MQWPTFDVPDGFTEQFLACDWLCYISPTMRKVGPDRLRALLRRWFDAGYTPKDIVYALDHYPTGELYETRTPAPNEKQRVIENWVQRRLRAWLDDEENPLPPVNSHIRERRDQVLVEQHKRREMYERERQLAADPRITPGAAQARVVARTAAAMSRRNRSEADARALAAIRLQQAEQKSRSQALEYLMRASDELF